MELIARLGSVFLPLIILAAAMSALGRKCDVFSVFCAGARGGLQTLARLLPTLCGLLCAISMLRASGLLDALATLTAPLLAKLGIPGEIAPLMLLRPFSGSGALAVGAELIQSAGADSHVGRLAAVMLASGETTLYTAGIYCGAGGIRKTRYGLLAAFAAEITAFFASSAAVWLLWQA